jgi:hypothetical protein
MKIIPYMRFFLAVYILFNYISLTILNLPEMNIMGDIGLFFSIISGVLTFSFISYCMIMGLQELINRQWIEAKYFQFFGLIFELLIFVTGLYLLFLLLPQQLEFWRIGLMIIWQLGLLILLIVDLKRIRVG